MIIDIFDTNKKYDVIYADPPWEYRQSSTMTQCQLKRYAIFPFVKSVEIRLYALCGQRSPT